MFAFLLAAAAAGCHRASLREAAQWDEAGVQTVGESAENVPASAAPGAFLPADDARPLAPAPKGEASLVSHEEPLLAPEEAGPNTLPTEEIPPPTADAAGTIGLPEVVASIRQAYPLVEAAIRERQVADGKSLAARGEFDLNLSAYSTSGPLGFYETYRHGVGFERATWKGGYLYGGYRLGDGNFQPWYKERETDEGGEFKVGAGVALLKNRAIDARRVALWQAELARGAVEPQIRMQLIEFTRLGSQAYWTWVASGQILQTQDDLLRLARDRARQIEERVKAGDLPRISRVNNDQLIASREAKRIEADRKLQASAIKLSLFLRSPDGAPLVAGAESLPASFPPLGRLAPERIEEDIQAALGARPEFLDLDLLARQIELDLAQAENSCLPKLDAKIEVSQDVGAPASSKADKSPLELEAGLYGEIPLERRAARGKAQAARAKLAQVRAKRQFVADKVVAEVRDAVSALSTAADREVRARQNERLAGETLRLGREMFTAGDIDLVELNLYEQAAAEARIQRISAEADYFLALADYRAALALEPDSAK